MISGTSRGGGSTPEESLPCRMSGSIIFDKYELGRLLGRGSFAKVYHGRSLTGHNVAVKVINKSGLMEEFLIREVSAMRILNHHPNILEIYEVMATKSKIYIVMEMAPGGELHSKLQKEGQFSETVALSYFHQLISALQFCHQNGVTHRDIKPQNLLLDEKGDLKISDFGLSALSEHLKNGLLHTACGTPAYTAPEVVARKGYDGAKADAWSCGVILYVFLVGCLPYDGSNLHSMYRAIHRLEFDMPYWVSEPAKSIIYRLLDPNPTTRISIEELMNLSWFKKSVKGSLEQQPEEDWKYLSKMKTFDLNAFDLISMSSGFNLSGLLEMRSNRKEMRFTSSARIWEIEEKIVKVGGELGYKVEKEIGRGTVGLVKGSMILIVEILEVAQGLWMVELRVKEGRIRTIDQFQESHWEELKVGFEDIALSWHNDYDGS